MNVKIYGIGGGMSEQFAGEARDPVTALNLLHLIGLLGGTGCSVHGPLRDEDPPLSGELSLEAADRMFRALRDEKTESVWLVSVHTGVYEDRCSRVFKAFRCETAAQTYKAALDAELKARGLDKAQKPAEMPWEDSNFHGFQVDYTGAKVSVSGPFPLAP